MNFNTAANRIFWEAAVECLRFGSTQAHNPYPASADCRGVLFELARLHAAARQTPTENLVTASLLSALLPLLPEALQNQNALKLLDRLAEVAVLLRLEQAKATDIKTSAEARREAQSNVDKLLAQRASLSDALSKLAS